MKVRFFGTVAVLGAVALLTMGASSCDQAGVGAGVSTAATSNAAQGSSGTDSSQSAPTATPTPSLEGAVGTVFSDTDGQGNVMNVKLVAVIDPAQGADSFTTPDNGKRFVGAKFSITGVSGSFSDDANSDATLIGSDSQTYSADFDDIAGCTNFSSGEYSVTSGQTSVGCVVFQVPSGVKVTQIQWSAGFSGSRATWDVST